MFAKPATMIRKTNSVVTGAASRRIALALSIVLLGSTSDSMGALYDFLTVASTGTASSQFTSQNGNGVINVRHVFSAGGAGAQDNNNAAIFPSQFTTLFPGTGQVQGNLAQTVYDHTSVVTFDLTGYNLSTSTIFGIWNTTDEVTGPPPVYQVQLIDASNTQVNPTTFNLFGNQDNQGQPLVTGRHELTMDTATGIITPGVAIGGNTHTDAAFWDNIPPTTKQIIVYGDLPALNLIGDGVGYYFAEVIPEPNALVLFSLGIMSMIGFRRSRRLKNVAVV